MGMDLAANPAKSNPFRLARTKCAVTPAASLQFFPTVMCQEERPVPGLPLECIYYFVLNKWCVSAVCCTGVLFALEKKSSTWLKM